MGVEGSALANAISMWAMTISLFIYIIVKKLHVQTWGGWSKDCLQEWGPFMNLAIPSMLMMCIEWWSFEIGAFLAGSISVVQLGGQAAMIQLVTVAIMFPVGLCTAANVRIGNALGAGNVEEAKKSSKVVLCIGALSGLIFGCFSAALKNVIGYIFTTDSDILILISRIMLVFAPFHICDATNFSCGGVLRGIGRQKIGAITNFIGYYFVGLPLGISLMFLVKLGIIGFWAGLLFPVALQTCIYVPYILRVDWNKACDEARFRAGVEGVQVQKSDNPDAGCGFNENGESMQANTENRSVAILRNIVSAETHEEEMVSDDLPLEASNVVGELLSTKQLIIRRGLAVFVCVTILLVGIAVHLIVKK